MKSPQERLERLKCMIERMYGPKGAAEAARRMGISNSGLATTLRGERDVTDNLELKMVKLVMDDIPRILADLTVARDCATETMRDLVGPEAWRTYEAHGELEIDLDGSDERDSSPPFKP